MQNIESFTFRFIQFSLIFGVLFYDFIGIYLGFTYIDEILLLVLLLSICYYGYINREIRFFGEIFIFFLVYSILFGVACTDAICIDAIIFLKPFVGYYAATSLGMRLDYKQKINIKKLVFFISIAMMFACAVSYHYIMCSFMVHPSRFATLYQILGVTYFYCSDRTKKDILITMLLFGCSLLSFRSKSYAFVATAIFLFYFFDSKRLEKIKITTLLSLMLCVGLIFIVAWEKFQFYFIIGSSDDLTESFARPALYQGAFLILKDYFPFGSGFGSYACYASSEFYSPLYYKYGLDSVNGLGDDPESAFICDTFFPQMAQFGILGVILLASFYHRRYKESIQYYKINSDSQLIKMILLILVFFVVESAVDSTFVHTRGMIMMVLWGMIINESRQKTEMSY